MGICIGREDATLSHFRYECLCNRLGATIDFSVVTVVGINASPDKKSKMKEARVGNLSANLFRSKASKTLERENGYHK